MTVFLVDEESKATKKAPWSLFPVSHSRADTLSNIVTCGSHCKKGSGGGGRRIMEGMNQSRAQYVYMETSQRNPLYK
jgi:hypothetical protein